MNSASVCCVVTTYKLTPVTFALSESRNASNWKS